LYTTSLNRAKKRRFVCGVLGVFCRGEEGHPLRRGPKDKRTRLRPVGGKKAALVFWPLRAEIAEKRRGEMEDFAWRWGRGEKP